MERPPSETTMPGSASVPPERHVPAAVADAASEGAAADLSAPAFAAPAPGPVQEASPADLAEGAGTEPAASPRPVAEAHSPAPAVISGPRAPGAGGAPLLPSLAAALVLVAGVLHLFLVEEHMAHARGAGLFFLAIGMAQVVWAFLYLRSPTPRLGQSGLGALIVAPMVLYAVTRIWRAPWSPGPEAVDVLGVVTLLVEAGAGLVMLWPMRPSLTWDDARVVAGIGILLAVGSYGGAIASEGVGWLAAAEEVHGHGDGHDDLSHDEDHGGHSAGFSGVRGESIVGTVPYYGPTTGQGIDQQCRAVGHNENGCWTFYLNNLLSAQGSIVAFDVLEELMAVNHDADRTSHTVAHILGHHAYQAYGLNITLTLGECSYDVFQGCLHGALQAYFSDLASQGQEITRENVAGICSAATTRFETYACMHGVGHGIMMYSNYDLHGSLDMCALLPDSYSRSSCYGGVVMENVVGYRQSTQPGHVPHDHGDGPPTYWVDEEDPAYPCNILKDQYQASCWYMQTSLILHFNGGDFRATAEVCEAAGKNRLPCWDSLGRDAVPYSGRDPARMSQWCDYGAEDAQASCIRAVTSGVILQDNDPASGPELCLQLPEHHKPMCYRESGRQANNMWGSEESALLCATVPDVYVATCDDGRA